jgi:pentose-5-phosphate-3-epimerase
MKIIPAILTDNLEEMKNQLEIVSDFTDEVDIDIMDGIFSTDKTVDIMQIPQVASLVNNLDLMVLKPEETIDKALERVKEKTLNIGRIFVHVETDFKLENILKQAKGNFSLGFSLTMETAAENFIDIWNKSKNLDKEIKLSLLLKTIQIGKQGNPYHPEVLAKIDIVRKAGFDGEIYLDGGIDPDIIFSFRNLNIAGVSVGSYISHSSDAIRAFQRLKDATWKKELD